MTVFFIISYCLLLALLTIHGLHRLWMVWTYLRAGRSLADQQPLDRWETLPPVTIQLPMYNEPAVAERIIESACRVDYPPDKLQVQVLDDSTDACAEITRQCCEHMRAAGVNIEYIHRDDRAGYKAGALANGLRTATGAYVAVFDADFIVPESFLRDTVDFFTDDEIGMVQTCWDHLNPDASLLTRLQAMCLDGHFLVEQTARAASGRWFNFNGTAGIWRRQCIDEAGGWQHDTLTEDTDLSYRAQLAGWRFCYLPHVRCAAELPPTIGALLGQQHRWNKGLVETAMKLLPRITRATAPMKRKIEAWFHLTSPVLYPVVLLISLLLPASLLAASASDPVLPSWVPEAVLWTGLACLTLGTGAVSVFYLAAAHARGRPMTASILMVPMLMALGIGSSVVNSAAVCGALARRRTPFVRTPKYNSTDLASNQRVAKSARKHLPLGGVVELVVCLAISASILTTIDQPPLVIGMPFALLFIVGFGWVGLGRLAASIEPG